MLGHDVVFSTATLYSSKTRTKVEVVFKHPLRRLDLRVVADALQQHGVGRRNQLAPSITRNGTSPRCMAVTQRSRCLTRSGM